jgi:hypothetical protein
MLDGTASDEDWGLVRASWQMAVPHPIGGTHWRIGVSTGGIKFIKCDLKLRQSRKWIWIDIYQNIYVVINSYEIHRNDLFLRIGCFAWSTFFKM